MKKLTIILGTVLILGCGLKNSQQLIYKPYTEVKTWLTEVQVNILIGSEEIQPGQTPKNVLLKQAELAGVTKATRDWIKKRLSFAPGNGTAYSELEKADLLKVNRDFDPLKDEMTNVYRRNFLVQVSFKPYKVFAGRVSGLEEGWTLGGQNQYAYVKLKNTFQDLERAYFIIAKRIKGGLNNSALQVTGCGKIFNVLDSRAKAEILSSSRTVEAGDHVFLLQVGVRPVEKGADEILPEEIQESEVMVEPKVREVEKELPKESK